MADRWHHAGWIASFIARCNPIGCRCGRSEHRDEGLHTPHEPGQALTVCRSNTASVFVEDYPDLVHKFGIRDSPHLVVNDQLVLKNQPTDAELRAYFDAKRKASP